MALNPKVRLGLGKVLYFSIFWLAAAEMYAIIERGIMGETTIYPATGNIYSFDSSVGILLFFGIIMGATLGSIEVFIFSKMFKSTSFGRKVITKTIFYVLGIYSLMIIMTFTVNSVRIGSSIFSNEVFESVVAFVTTFAFWSIMIYGMIAIALSLFIMEIRENIGVGIFKNFLFGTYHNPIEETRLFMFLDMKSSTTIAEKLGHVRYFNLLNDYYADLSDPILESEGTIYQYVGDEVIVSWDANLNKHVDASISCFFQMQEVMKGRKEKYIDKYGLAPEFRAGIHLGEVTTGEIGVLKKDIIFTGDVLNTTSRVQAKSKELQEDLLVSEDVVQYIGLQKTFDFVSKGTFQLKGKEQEKELFAVNLSNQTLS